MTDPLSITAGVIGVVTFALQGSKVLCDVIGTYQDAGSTLTDLKADVDITSTTLASIAGSLQNTNDSSFSDSVRKCLQEAKPAITGVETLAGTSPMSYWKSCRILRIRK